MCKFCEEYLFAKALNDASGRDYGEETYIKYVYYASLVVKGFKNKGLMKSTRTYIPRTLNYCPSCGKRLNEERKED